MGKEAGDEKTTQKQVKTPLGQRFGEWLHHTPSSAEDEHTYCGTRNTKKWRDILLFYALFYGALVAFWAINYAAMLAHIPPLIGGVGPLVNTIKSFGFVTIAGGVPDYSAIADDDGSDTYTGSGATEALGSFRHLGTQDFSSLQVAINSTTGVSGEQFLWNNCTSGAGCAPGASNYGDFGPVYLVTYRNRKWNRPEQGSTCNIVCSYDATFADGSNQIGVIANDHFWQLDFETNQWLAGNANIDCRAFQNQPNYRIQTAVSTQGYTGFVTQYALSCTVADLETDNSAGITSTYVA